MDSSNYVQVQMILAASSLNRTIHYSQLSFLTETAEQIGTAADVWRQSDDPRFLTSQPSCPPAAVQSSAFLC